MTTEEKAKRFDEVVEEFRGLLEGVYEDKCDIMEEDILKILPELKISEDERIRKSLIQGFNECLDSSSYPKNAKKYWHGIAIDDILTWLEKQGQKPTTDIQNLTWEDIEKIGDFINTVQNENPNGIGAECLYTDVLERFLDGKQTKQKPVEWSDENKKIIDDIIEYLECFNDYDCGDEPYEEYYERFEKYIKFMESLKPQSHWKPSEEHIRYLQAVVNDVHNIGSESCHIALRDLLEQLKKL